MWTAWWALRGRREEKRTEKEEEDKDKRRRKRADEEDSRRMEEMEGKVLERVNAALRHFEDVLIRERLRQAHLTFIDNLGLALRCR